LQFAVALTTSAIGLGRSTPKDEHQESNGRVNSSFAKRGLELQPQQPVEEQERGAGNHGSTGLLASSVGRGWSGLAAELRSHSSGVIAWRNPRPDTEICVDVHGGASVVTRKRHGITDRTVSERGTIWLSPPRGPEGLIEMSDPMPAILHIYLPPSQFSPKNLGEGSDLPAVASLRYEGSFQDPLVAEIAYAITSELQRETSAGSMLIETLASSLAARLVQNHVGTLSDVSARAARAGLDRRRLTRVLDYIETNLEGDLTLARLASIACLSRFHFSRAFKAAVGRSPHHYVSVKRLELAKQLLGKGDQPLVDIALTLKFSCQANFTRAFREATGQTPAQYRRSVG
jgi:AraC family transcriptional regulator